MQKKYFLANLKKYFLTNLQGFFNLAIAIYRQLHLVNNGW